MIYLTFVVFQRHQVDALKPKHISHQHIRKYKYTHHHHHHHGTNLHYSSLNNIGRGGGRSQKEQSTPSNNPRASKKLLQSMRLLYLTYYASLGALMRK